MWRGRQNPQYPEAKLEEYFGTIERLFGIGWLNSKKVNLVQTLWHRRDWLSTLELAVLGESLLTTEILSTAWALEATKKLKSDDEKSARGAAFEALLATTLHNPPAQQVRLPSPNNPGYDLTVAWTNGRNISMSLKSFGRSEHSKKLTERGAQVRSWARTAAKTSAVEIRLIAKSRHPQAPDWNIARGQIMEMVQQTSDQMPQSVEVGDWFISVRPLSPPTGTQWETSQFSDSVTILAPFHPNEYKNISDKLQSALWNLDKYGARESESHRKVAIIGIPEDLGITDPESSIRYCFMNGYDGVSAIGLWQCGIIDDPSKDEKRFAIALKLVSHGDFDTWMRQGENHLEMRLPAGQALNRWPAITAFTEHIEADLADYYAYQAGDYYLVAQEGQEVTLNSTNCTNRITRHIVLTVGGQKLPNYIEQKHKPPERLLLF